VPSKKNYCFTGTIRSLAFHQIKLYDSGVAKGLSPSYNLGNNKACNPNVMKVTFDSGNELINQTFSQQIF